MGDFCDDVKGEDVGLSCVRLGPGTSDIVLTVREGIVFWRVCEGESVRVCGGVPVRGEAVRLSGGVSVRVWRGDTEESEVVISFDEDSFTGGREPHSITVSLETDMLD